MPAGAMKGDDVSRLQKVYGRLREAQFMCDGVRFTDASGKVVDVLRRDGDPDEMAGEFETTVGWKVLEQYDDEVGQSVLVVRLPESLLR